jgi:hypothetical protein
MSNRLQPALADLERVDQPRVPAAIHPSISRFLADHALVRLLVDGFG